jgi:2-iminoacetate synthase
MNKKRFIDEAVINSFIKKRTDSRRTSEILEKSLELKGLNLEEAASLINISDEDSLEALFCTASQIKNEIYGNRLVLFAPLYVSNHCSNNCLYCGFRKDNRDMHRRCLNLDEVKEETEIILSQGHKRILMLMGEHANECDFDYFLNAIDAAYSARDLKASIIRRINVEIAPLTEDEFQKLKNVKIGTYTVFQETYHEPTYKKMHPSGKKADYDWRLNVMDRALENGLNDVGIGALFGLHDYKFEMLALLQHAQHLDETYGVGPHTISVPRIEHAQNAPASENIPHPVSDIDFKKLVAILRCAVPYTGIILSTRESAEMRQQLFGLGISQISAGSKTNPGGYKEAIINPEDEEQFELNDTRSSGEVIKSVIEQGYIPSFCTGCYRLGRVGQDFMDLAKPGLIKLHCLPNALTTLKEYLVDYADDETRELGNKLIAKELMKIPDDFVRKRTGEYLVKIENGLRDLYF